MDSNLIPKSWINPPCKELPTKVVVEGIMGAGKTTLARQLAEYLDYKLLEEPVADNALLSRFYEDPVKYGFMFQIHMLTKRCELERAGTYMVVAGQAKGVVYDRCLPGDTCFAEVNTATGNISPEEYGVYLGLYELMKYSSPYPDVIVYLDVPLDALVARIAARKREFEADVPIEYLRALGEAYGRFCGAMEHCTTVIRVDWSTYQPAEEIWKQVLDVYQAEDQHRATKQLLRH